MTFLSANQPPNTGDSEILYLLHKSNARSINTKKNFKYTWDKCVPFTINFIKKSPFQLNHIKILTCFSAP